MLIISQVFKLVNYKENITINQRPTGVKSVDLDLPNKITAKINRKSSKEIRRGWESKIEMNKKDHKKFLGNEYEWKKHWKFYNNTKNI